MRRMRFRTHFLFALSCLFVFFLAAVSFAAPDQALLDRAKELQGDLLRDLEILVNIDSPSGHGPGSEKIMEILSEKLRTLGGKVEILPAPQGGGIQCGCHLSGERERENLPPGPLRHGLQGRNRGRTSLQGCQWESLRAGSGR